MTAAELEKSLLPQRIRYAFWVDRNEWFNAANEKALDDWLTANLRVYSEVDLLEAFVVLKEKGVLSPNLSKEMAQKLGKPQPPTVAFEKAAPAPAAEVPAEPVVVALDAGVPAELTKSFLRKCSADELRAAFGKYGEAQIMARINGQ